MITFLEKLLYDTILIFRNMINNQIINILPLNIECCIFYIDIVNGFFNDKRSPAILTNGSFLSIIYLKLSTTLGALRRNKRHSFSSLSRIIKIS